MRIDGKLQIENEIVEADPADPPHPELFILSGLTSLPETRKGLGG